MKLDKIRFATLIGYISHITGSTLASEEVAAIDATIDVEIPIQEPYRADIGAVDNLLCCMITATDAGFIPAIKAYRALTNAGLKEAKEAIERFRQPIKKMYDPADLRKALKDAKYDNAGDYYVVERFINNL